MIAALLVNAISRRPARRPWRLDCRTGLSRNWPTQRSAHRTIRWRTPACRHHCRPLGHVREAVLHRFGHRPGCLREPRYAAGAQVLDELRLGPAANAGMSVRGYVVRVPASEYRAAEETAGAFVERFFLHAGPARRMAG